MIYCRYDVAEERRRPGRRLHRRGPQHRGLQSQVRQRHSDDGDPTSSRDLFWASAFLLIQPVDLHDRKGRGLSEVIEMGDIPSKPLTSQAEDEMETLVTGINLMVDALRGKEC